ncbi:PREDICTED: protein MIZU-KUSSEI 1-like [Camelina sativa]|uniref:Protein MIZU-KUSSEI 1-like n=1 Tax=Camelina sativa TaxID=90675 RepID=A0ABM0Y001_CAMSA|nr:PREDICTED: protein MIZU-KUSSEI 1-like [Camelina sativa]
MAKGNSHDFTSKRHNSSFHWTRKVGSDENDDVSSTHNPLPDHNNSKPASKHTPSSSSSSSSSNVITQKRKLQSFAVSRLRSVIATLSRARPGHHHSGLGSRVVGTLFGSRRGHVHFSIQKDPNSPPAFLIELATPISGLVKEMASGLVRIALECDKGKEEDEGEEKNKTLRHGGGDKTKTTTATAAISRRLVEEPMWRTYCNGKKCGFATRRECGEKEKKVLKALEMVSMGAGVLPETEDTGGDGGGDVMYMRAKFERIVGSRDSEAFYMMNPDSNGAPELSIYLLRI